MVWSERIEPRRRAGVTPGPLIGRPDGAEATTDVIEHGLQVCMSQLSAAGTKPILFGEVRDQYGGIDVLINNAGIQIAEDSHLLAIEQFDKVLAVDLRGAFLCAHSGSTPATGVVVAKNLRLAELARDRVTEFLLVVARQAARRTGAWVAPPDHRLGLTPAGRRRLQRG
ncbi:MAG: SDR family NAD(P)-dependent oxidoreductase [Pseudonocardiales bacterium]|nr:SDR family NAD(P)-dependent oxidoreductase [Pseudonocardiales bacterium]